MSDNIKRHPDPALVEVRRKQVLDAAARCFCRHGYHGASMAEIACAAAMSPGHIYHYFENKRAIVEAIIEQDVEELFSIMRDLQNQPGELLDAIIDGLHTSVDQNLDTDRGTLLLEMFAEAARNPKVAALLRSADALTRQSDSPCGFAAESCDGVDTSGGVSCWPARVGCSRSATPTSSTVASR
jgi:AcrR family transcriptional regulator